MSAAAQASGGKARPLAIHYPDLPEVPAYSGGSVTSAEFWRAAYLRDVAELDALVDFVNSAWELTMPAPLKNALTGAQAHAEKEVDRSLGKLICHGGLLYAWVPEGGAA